MKRLLTPPLAVAALVFGPPTNASAHGGGGGPPPTELLAIVSAWHVDLPVIAGLIVTGLLYVEAARSVNAAHPGNRWPARRTAAFIGALVAIGLALLSPIDVLSGELLTVHMVQHLLLVAVAAPLFAASGIGTLALRFATPDVRNTYLLPFLHSRLVTALTFPVVGWIAFVAVMWGAHFTTLYNAALLDDGVHAIEHLLFLGAACLFWWPLLSPDPLRWRIHPGGKLIALLAQMPPMSFLAITIIGAATPLYAAYLGRSDPFGLDALSDQRIAGSLMWVTGDLSLLIPGAFLLVLLIRHEEAEAKRIDAQLDRARARAQKEFR